MIQATSTIFAIAAAGTVLLVERIGTDSPTSLRFLPTWLVVGLFSFFGFVIVADIVVLPAMPSETRYSWFLNLIITLNIGCVLVAVLYARDLMAWLKPEKLFAVISNRGKKTKSKEEAFELVRATDELGIRAAINHEIWRVSEAVNTCVDLSESFCVTWKEEDPGYDVYHPIRMVARSVTSIGLEAICSGSDIFGERCVGALCKMADFHDQNRIHIDVLIFANIERIAEALIRKGKGEGCIYTLIIESKVAADQGRLSLSNWLMCNFDELARLSEKWKDYESYRSLCIGTEVLLDVFSTKPATVYNLHSIEKALDILEKIAAKEEFRNYKGYLGERGWTTERSVGEILARTQPLLAKARKMAFVPEKEIGQGIKNDLTP